MWNVATSNKLCSDRFTNASHQKHLTNVNGVKASVDNGAPVVPEFLRSRAKQEKMKETRAAVIQYENRVLLDKMMGIEKKKTQLNPDQIAKKSFHKVKTLNTNRRITDLKKINDQNKALLKRLQATGSVYSIDKWIQDDKKNNTFRRNISQNARRTHHADFSEPPRFGRSFYGSQFGQSNGFQSGMYYEC